MIDDAESWVKMRLLRNRLVHEYVEDLARLAEDLELAHRYAEALQCAWRRLRSQVQQDPLGTGEGDAAE